MPSSDHSKPCISYFSDDEARALLAEHFGVDGTLSRLAGYVDQNYRVQVPNGTGWVFKIMPSDERLDRLEMQNQALERIAEAELGIQTPVSALSVTGTAIAWAYAGKGDAKGNPHPLRLLSYLPGDVFVAANPRSTRLLESLGAAVGCLHHALEGFEHPAAHQDSGDWDVTRAAEVVSAGIGSITDPARRSMVERIKVCFEVDASPSLAALPCGVIHGDANDYNVLVSPPTLDGRHVTGILDFGDLIHGPLVADLAIAAAYGCLGTPNPLAACAAIARGYLTEHPLSEAEANVLYAMIRGRLATSVVNSARRSRSDREDLYLSVSEAPAWEAMEAFDSIHPHLARAVLRNAAGHPPCPNSVTVERWLRANREQCGPIVEAPLTDAETVVFDVSPGSLDVGRLDTVLDAAASTRVMFERMDQVGVPVGVGKYDEPRLWYASDEYAEGKSEFPERRTIHTAVDLFMRPGTPLLAPMDSTVHSFRDNDERLDYGPTIVLEHSPEGGPTFWTLYGHLTNDSLDGIAVGMRVARGRNSPALATTPKTVTGLRMSTSSS